jgi:hypothetical protein
MSVPALLLDFPPPTSPSQPAAARHLGRQWPIFWRLGNVFFRPISTLGIFGYAYAGWMAAVRGRNGADWRWYALSSVCHLVTVVHSAVNMQPINAKLEGLRYVKVKEKDVDDGVGDGDVDVRRAEEYARRWARLNVVRMVMPLVAGSVALWQSMREHMR